MNLGVFTTGEYSPGHGLFLSVMETQEAGSSYGLFLTPFNSGEGGPVSYDIAANGGAVEVEATADFAFIQILKYTHAPTAAAVRVAARADFQPYVFAGMASVNVAANAVVQNTHNIISEGAAVEIGGTSPSAYGYNYVNSTLASFNVETRRGSSSDSSGSAQLLLSASGEGLTGQTGSANARLLFGASGISGDETSSPHFFFSASGTGIPSPLSNGDGKLFFSASGSGISGETSSGAALVIGLSVSSESHSSILTKNTVTCSLTFSASGAGIAGQVGLVDTSLIQVIVVEGESYSNSNGISGAITLLLSAAGHSFEPMSDGKIAVVNLVARGVTEYSQAANSVAVVNGEVYFASGDGIFKLEPGGEVSATIKTGKFNDDSKLIKTLSRGYVTGEADGDMEMDIASSVGEYTYPLPQVEPGLITRRAVLGRGHQSHYYQATLRNMDGAYFTVEDIDIPLSEGRRLV